MTLHCHCSTSRRLVGDPIDVVTGANVDQSLDFELPGPLPLRWWRYYDSQRNSTPGSLGWGHSHHFERTLRFDLDGISYSEPTGEEFGFPELQPDESASQRGRVLRRIDERTYWIETAAEPIFEFQFADDRSVARLRRVMDGDSSIAFRHTPDGRLIEIVDSTGRTIRVESDADGRVVQLIRRAGNATLPDRSLIAYAYDEAGQLVTARDFRGYSQTYHYDAARRVTRRTDRRGYSFHFTYDQLGRCTHSRGDDGLLEVFLDYEPQAQTTLVRHGGGGQWVYGYDEFGTITHITDPYGNLTRIVVDELGRPAQEIDPLGNVTQLLYDETGAHVARLTPQGYELPPLEDDPDPDDPLSYELPETPLEWELGCLLDPAVIQAPDREDPVLRQFPASVVNSVIASPPEVNASPDAVAPPDEPSSPTIGLIVPDRSNRPDRDEKSVGGLFAARRRYDPNGNLIEFRDREGASYRFTYASWNLPYQEIDPLENTATFHYGANLELARLIDAGGTEHRFEYDLKDRLTEIYYQGRLLDRHVYDQADNLIERRDGDGRPLVAWEIGSGNLDKVRRLASGETHAYQHDEAGRVTEAVGPAGVVHRAYDPTGRLLRDHRDGRGVDHAFEYGTLVATTYFGKFIVEYHTDDEGHLHLKDPTGDVHRLSISPNGLVSREMAGGARELSQFDGAGRCRRKALVLDTDETVSRSQAYEYSAEGDLQSVVDSHDGTTRYAYDAAHRLTREIGPVATYDFEYDRAGNLLRQPGLRDVRLDSGNRLAAANGRSFAYDRRENLAARTGPDGSTRYLYDDLDRLVACELDGERWTAEYDALDRRVRKTWRGSTTEFFWDGFRLAAERRGDGSLRLYVYPDAESLVPWLFVDYESEDAAPDSGRTYYVFTNQIGAPIRVETASGACVWAARIAAYGLATIAPESSIEMALRFPGHYFDAETGLQYNWLRYYCPELGRYLQPDPLGIEGGLNLYAYVDHPLVDVDLDGLAKCGSRSGKSRKPPKRKSSRPKSKKRTKAVDPKKKYARPGKFRKGVRDKAWEAAKKRSRDGKVRDPLTKKVMKKSDPWDMGHRPGFEFRKHKKSAKRRRISRKKFLDEHNDPRKYRPELPSSNRSHAGEDNSDRYKGP